MCTALYYLVGGGGTYSRAFWAETKNGYHHYANGTKGLDNWSYCSKWGAIEAKERVSLVLNS